MFKFVILTISISIGVVVSYYFFSKRKKTDKSVMLKSKIQFGQNKDAICKSCGHFGSSSECKVADAEDMPINTNVDVEFADSERAKPLVCEIDFDSISAEIRELILQRISEVNEKIANCELFLIALVDLYDEIRFLSSKDNNSIFEFLLNSIEQHIKHHDGMLVKEKELRPDYQKIIIATQSSAVQEPVILENISSGLVYKNNVLKKQEISILTPNEQEKNHE